MSRKGRLVAALGAAFSLISLGAQNAAAQAPDLSGKTVHLIIGFGVGGGYDLWGRTVGRYIGKHLPGNPTVVPQNMPGAGSVVAANYLYNIAPKDGTTFGIIARDAPLVPLTSGKGVRFDATKLSWLGSPTNETNVCIAWHTAEVKKIDDLFHTQLIVGDTGIGTGTHSYPKALNGLLGMKFKLVSGFTSSSNVFLAMERGEVEGICESIDSVEHRKPDWIPKKTISVLFQAGAAPSPELPGVPFILDYAKTDEQKQALRFLYAGQGIGRPFAAPPDLPPATMKMLRDAFTATMKDPEFVAEVKKLKLHLAPEDGAQLAGLINQIYATPKAVMDKVGELIK